jgi:ATP-binding cassette subfamily C protein CydC
MIVLELSRWQWDEPTAHLGPENRRALAADLLAATAGRSLLLITHDLDGLDQLVETGRVYQRFWHAGRCG